MSRNLKVLGLALAAVFAMSAIAAQAAMAHEFIAGATPATLEANGTNHTFTVSGSTVNCKKAHFAGEQATSPASSVTVHPSYEECEFFEEPATVTTTGCDYVFSAEPTTGNVSVSCSGTAKITVATSSCTMKFGSQTTGGKAVYTTLASSPKTVEVKSEVTNVKIAEKSGPLCFLLGSEGSYSGTAVTKAFSGGVQVNAEWK